MSIAFASRLPDRAAFVRYTAREPGGQYGERARRADTSIVAGGLRQRQASRYGVTFVTPCYVFCNIENPVVARLFFVFFKM